MMPARFAAFFSLLLLFPLAVHAAPQKPNIVLLVADDLGYGETACQGNPQIPTPHIDALARNGVRMTSGYVTASYCSSSRAGFITGRYQTRFGHEFNPTGKYNLSPLAGLPLSQKTIADRLKAAGYATGLVGKWHLGGHEKFHPLNRGFDEFYGFLHEGHYFKPPPYQGVLTFLRQKKLPAGSGPRVRKGDVIYSSHMGHNEPEYDQHNPILRGRQPLVEKQYLTDALTREAKAFISRHADQPFFLYLAYNAVHSPMQGAEKYLQRFEKIEDVHRRIFAAMLANLDDSIGAVVQHLRDKELEDNTLIFFFSDNGGPTRELTSSNLPLRGGKGSLFEGGVRIPFIVQWKGVLPANQVYAKAVSSLDILPTALAAAGQPPVESDGVNLAPFLTGKNLKPPHNVLYWRMGPRTALRRGDWKIICNGNNPSSSKAAFELYNLAADLGETRNVAAAHPKEFTQLHADWERLNAQMVSPVWQRPQR